MQFLVYITFLVNVKKKHIPHTLLIIFMFNLNNTNLSWDEFKTEHLELAAFIWHNIYWIWGKCKTKFITHTVFVLLFPCGHQTKHIGSVVNVKQNILHLQLLFHYLYPNIKQNIYIETILNVKQSLLHSLHSFYFTICMRTSIVK